MRRIGISEASSGLWQQGGPVDFFQQNLLRITDDVISVIKGSMAAEGPGQES
jgi:hypothetical protein